MVGSGDARSDPGVLDFYNQWLNLINPPKDFLLSLSTSYPDAAPSRADQDRLSQLPLLSAPRTLEIQQNPPCRVQGFFSSHFYLGDIPKPGGCTVRH